MFGWWRPSRLSQSWINDECVREVNVGVVNFIHKPDWGAFVRVLFGQVQVDGPLAFFVWSLFGACIKLDGYLWIRFRTLSPCRLGSLWLGCSSAWKCLFICVLPITSYWTTSLCAVYLLYYTLKFIIYPFYHDFTFVGFIYLQLVRLLFWSCWKKKSSIICWVAWVVFNDFDWIAFGIDWGQDVDLRFSWMVRDENAFWRVCSCYHWHWRC
jgi:hypothetical protein